MIQKKVAIIGATGVGKTSLIRQYVEGIFSEKYLTSIGVKIDKKLIELESKKVQFMIWDIEGIDQFSSFNTKYLRGTSGVIIVADVTRSSSFNEASTILLDVKKQLDIPCILACNKTDLTELPTDDTLKETTEKFNFVYETSAKTGKNVEAMFYQLATAVCE
ncbi:Rab family GTPase [Algibacillus agarilyticus]|uniref:Rab family GTPase n=1 Tax=Algibacillus agarilyticus TaxID=2234133 RepID=UPI000DD08B03|nr:Rab family GTPase [Algibacillus agarilyticus]